MMANENYAQVAFRKMQLYNINGIMLSDTLLATYESEEAHLKSNIVENMIQQYFPVSYTHLTLPTKLEV